MFIKYTYSFSFLLLFFLSSQVSNAQQTQWSLDDCLLQVRNHSRELRGAQLKVAHQEIGVEQQARSKDPKLYANTQMGWQFGRNIDPTTNSFNNQGIFFQSATIQGNFTLYQGGRLAYVKQQQNANLEAATADAQQVEFQLKLDVTNAYLRILLAQEQATLLESTVKASSEQLQRITRDIAIGVRPQRDQVNIQAQLAIEQRNLTDATYKLDEAYRSLKHLIGLPVEHSIEIEKNLDLDWQKAQTLSRTDLDEMKALQAFPAFQASNARLRAVEAEQLKIKAEQMPSVELFGNIGSQFSSAAQKLDGYTEQQTDQEVWLEGESTTLSVMQLVPNYANDPYGQQFKNNFGQSIGLRATWAIWDGKASSFAQQQASVNKLEAELAIQKNAEWFNYELDRSFRYLEASRSSYQLAKQSVQATQEAYAMTEAAFTAGGASAYELLDIKRRLDNAKINLIEARYDCLFAYKIVRSLY